MPSIGRDADPIYQLGEQGPLSLSGTFERLAHRIVRGLAMHMTPEELKPEVDLYVVCDSLIWQRAREDSAKWKAEREGAR